MSPVNMHIVSYADSALNKCQNLSEPLTEKKKKNVHSVRDVTRRSLKRIFEAQSGWSRPLPSWQHIIENGQKGRRWVELVAETTPAQRNSNPPFTQLAMPLIMQNFKAYYNLDVRIIK